jgi:WD40 repeat protein
MSTCLKLCVRVSLVFSLASVIVCAQTPAAPGPSTTQTPTANPAGVSPKLVLETGHTAGSSALAFSPDNRLVASSGGRGDKTIKLWSVKTGYLLRTLTGHTGNVGALAFSPDGRWLASGSEDETVKIWEVLIGREVRALNGAAGGINLLVFSPNGRWLLSRSMEHEAGIPLGPCKAPSHGSCITQTVKLWHATTGRVVRVLPGKVWGDVVFSADSRKVVAGGEGDTLRMWDVLTGRALPAPVGANAPAVFSADGQLLAARSSAGGVKVWDAATGRPLQTLAETIAPLGFSRDGRRLITQNSEANRQEIEEIKLWEVATGRELRALSGRITNPYYLQTSADGRWLAAISFFWGELTLWDIDAGEKFRTHAGWSGPIAFSLDGQWLASGGADGTLRLLELDTKRARCAQTGSVEMVSSTAISPKGRWLASGNSAGQIKLWDLSAGAQVRTLAGHQEEVAGLAFSPDERLLISGGSLRGGTEYGVTYVPPLATSNRPAEVVEQVERLDTLDCPPAVERFRGEAAPEGYLGLWDLVGGKSSGFWGGASAPVAVSRDALLVAAESDDPFDLKRWSLTTLSELPPLVTQQEGLLRQGILSLAFSPDGHMLASTGRTSSEIRLWQMDTGRNVQNLAGHTDRINAVAFSPDGHTLASASWDNTIKFWDVSTGRVTDTWATPNSDLRSLVFSPEGRWLAAGAYDNSARVWEVKTGRQITLTGHASAVQTVAFANEQRLLTGSADGTVRIWEPETGALLASLISLGNGEDWLVVTPAGLFDGSPAAWNKILWRFSQNTFDVVPVEAFYNEFYYPGLLADIMASRRLPAPQGKDISRKDRRQIPVQVKTVERIEPNAAVAARKVKLQVEVEEAPAGADSFDQRKQLPPSGAKDIRLFRNGTLVKLWRGAWGASDGCKLQPQAAPQSPRRTVCTATVQIIAGQNQFTAYAFNNDNIKSADATLIIKGDAERLRRKGIIYVVAVGVNEYAPNPFFPNLKFAVADADDLAAEIKRQQEQLAQYEHVEVIKLPDSAATKANILGALAELAKKAQPEDAVIVYFSGHGQAADGQFYLIPHDIAPAVGQTEQPATLDALLATHAISAAQLEDAFEGVDAGHLTLIIDACHSGQALGGAQEGRGPVNAKGLAQLAYDKGMYVLTAAQSYQVANESRGLKHGYLTYALIEEGLKLGAADAAPPDGAVSLREWFDYATERVPAVYREEKARREADAMAQLRGLKLGGAADDAVQRPRVFYRRELEAQPLVIARPAAQHNN